MDIEIGEVPQLTPVVRVSIAPYVNNHTIITGCDLCAARWFTGFDEKEKCYGCNWMIGSSYLSILCADIKDTK